MWRVLIKEFGTNEIVDTVEAGASEHSALSVERGININLHEDYYTEIDEDYYTEIEQYEPKK